MLKNIVKNTVIFFFLLCLFGCDLFNPSKVNQKLEVKSFYKRDMVINGHEGVAVLPLKEKIEFHIEARGALDLFTMVTCNQSQTKERAWNVKQRVRSGLFGWRRKLIDNQREIKFEYQPNELEKDGYCPIEFGGYEKDQGRHSWGFVDFQTPDATLPATLLCNGEVIKSLGVSICQSRQGLVQKITFAEEAVVAPDKECDIGQRTGKSFEFRIPPRQCVFRFRSIKTGRDHRLTTLGFKEILIRGD